MGIFEKIEMLTGLSPGIQGKILSSLIIIILAWAIRIAVIKMIWHRTDEVRIRYQWKRTTAYLMIFFTLLLLGAIWIRQFRAIGTFLGLLSAGLAIAFKDLLTNIIGWLFIMARKPFRVGDRIEINQLAGDVIDIHIFRFTILELGNWVKADQTTGRIIHIPNGFITILPKEKREPGREIHTNPGILINPDKGINN